MTLEGEEKTFGMGLSSSFTCVYKASRILCLALLQSQELPRAHHCRGLWVSCVTIGTLSVFVGVWVGNESPDWLRGCSRWSTAVGKSLNGINSNLERCNPICSKTFLPWKGVRCVHEWAAFAQRRSWKPSQTWRGREKEERGPGWGRGRNNRALVQGRSCAQKLAAAATPVLKCIRVAFNFIQIWFFPNLELTLSLALIIYWVWFMLNLTWQGAKWIEVRVTHFGLSAFLEVVHPNEPVCPETKLGNLWAGEKFLPSFKEQLWVLSAKFEEEFLPVCTN